MLRIFTFAIAHLLFVSKGFAHVGHLGEVAGHAHWVGVAAIAGAVALGALAGRFKDKTQDDASAEDEVSDETVEGETA